MDMLSPLSFFEISTTWELLMYGLQGDNFPFSPTKVSNKQP